MKPIELQRASLISSPVYTHEYEVLKWAQERIHLIRWLKAAEDGMDFGKVEIFCQNGKFTAMDVCIRERVGLTEPD